MLSAVLDILFQGAVQLGQFVIFSCQARHFFVALIDLVYSQPMSVFGLVQNFSQVVVSHDLCLGAFVVVD